ncbi:procollagen C-endopeptidase enhancer 1-like [Pyrgilauda ruficollis]|uniref:procollagen C-endopeptidase enhancer 1-like n=1 Tax=Pyrgilauda ruficollis TaxID=221976 RepID=UPI001B875C9C|nr:procollagen C-endopeptidase enhancer 1-like [Pyrgilauda ruficollis]
MSRLGPLLLLLLGALSPPRAAGQEPPPSPPPPARPNASRPVWPVFPCGGDHRGESGFIASEGFPRHYPPGSNCTWTITVPEGQVATLSFRVFDLEPEPRCRFDALAVFGGHGPAAPLLGRFCGTFRPGALRAPQNRLRLHMESDGGTAGRGFLAWFSAGSPPSNGGCGATGRPPRSARGGAPETPAPKPRGGPKAKPTPAPKAEPPTAAPCPQRCRRAGTLQSNFCSSDFVLSGAVKSLSRGPPHGPAWAALSVLGLYKWRPLGAPPPAAGSSLRLQLPCRLCPALKRGSSYVLMGRLAADGAALLPPDAFVVPYRPQQQQKVLENLSKRPCRGTP